MKPLQQLLLNSFLTAVLLASADSVRYQDYEEGRCLPFRPQANFNTTWFATTPLPYLTGGNRYHLYHSFSGYPPLADMREFEFLYDACLQSYSNLTTGEGSMTGFGQQIGSYELRATNRRGVFDFVPPPSSGLTVTDAVEHVVTLTDNKSFVFYANCWKGINQRGWDVLASTPRLDANTLKMIEDHAISLGFDREHFLFLRYDSCNLSSSNETEKFKSKVRSKVGGGWQGGARSWSVRY